MERNKEIYKVTMVGGAVNVILLLFKFVAGIVGHSAAMVADAVHSLSDFVTDIIVLVFVHISGKPKDKSHDYGHGLFPGHKARNLRLLAFWLCGLHCYR